MVGTLSQPFPHIDAWNMPQSFWTERPDHRQRHCRGQVWADYRGLEPMMDATGARHTFETWYVSWLEAALKKFEVT